MNRRIFMWLASLAPALLGAKKSFARTGRYANVTDEMIRRNEKLIVREARKTECAGVFIKEWYDGSVKLYRYSMGGYAHAKVSGGPYRFEIGIDVDAFIKVDNELWAPVDDSCDYRVCEFRKVELMLPIIDGTGVATGEVGCHSWHESPVITLASCGNDVVSLVSRDYGDLEIRISPSKLLQARKEKIKYLEIEWDECPSEERTRMYKCHFYCKDLDNKEPTELESAFVRLPLTLDETNSWTVDWADS